MNGNKDYLSLYERFLNGTASAADLQKLYVFFGSTDESYLRTIIAEAIEKESADVPSNEELERTLEAIHRRIDRTTTIPPQTVKLWYWATAIAAMLVIAIGLIIWQHEVPAQKMITVAYGKTQEIRLPDSSEVWLNAGSTLQYPAHFTGNTRTVYLENGEAFFQVVHKQNTPFIVNTGKAKITVLGTSFDVSAFQLDETLKVAVRSGKVGVSEGQKTIILLAGQRAIVNKTAATINVIQVNPTDIAAWREQRLIFEDQPLGEVMQALERKYNVHIEVQNKQLLTEHITMHLDNQPLADILNGLSFSKHFNYSFAPNRKSVIVK